MYLVLEYLFAINRSTVSSTVARASALIRVAGQAVLSSAWQAILVVWQVILIVSGSEVFQNVAGWLVVVILLVWLVSKKFVAPGAPLPRVQERIASVIGLRMDPRDSLWATVNSNVIRREKEYNTYLLWNVEDLKNGYLYSFPPPGRPWRAEAASELKLRSGAHPMARLIPIDPCRASGKPELVFLTGKSMSFKTRTAKAIAQALDKRNRDILAIRKFMADLVHIKEIYSEDGSISALQADNLVRELATHARESRPVPGDLLFIIDVMRGWPKDEIVEFIARILRNKNLYRREELTVLLVLPEPEIKPGGTLLEGLQEIYASAKEPQNAEDAKKKSSWDRWEAQFFSTVDSGADIVIERLAEQMFVDITKDRFFGLVKPFRAHAASVCFWTRWGRARRLSWRLALQQTLRDLAARNYEVHDNLARGPLPGVPGFYTKFSRTILGREKNDKAQKVTGYPISRWGLRRLWPKAHKVVILDAQGSQVSNGLREAVQSYLTALEALNR